MSGVRISTFEFGGDTPHSVCGKAHQPFSDTTTNKIPLCFQQLEEKLKGQADYEEVKKELKLAHTAEESLGLGPCGLRASPLLLAASASRGPCHALGTPFCPQLHPDPSADPPSALPDGGDRRPRLPEPLPPNDSSGLGFSPPPAPVSPG
ncbi:hypothetical protein J1605_016592 [Eschrichtius robustus]|uniref:Uncharacterized protein n=1 Tax=Eschrichtius robustus TaxID=9764 RepID=A0AB34I5M1_ESCRO|nr:hypothetical protein J1605_016592 [Eschrichtius robustus]